MNVLPRPRPSLCADTRSAVQRDQVLHQREADAQAALRAIGRARRLLEQVEDPRQHLGGDADPVVLHGQDQLPVVRGDAELDVAAGIGVAGGVGQQIGDHLREADRIGVAEKAALFAMNRQPVMPLLEQVARHLDRLGGDVGQVDDLAPQLDLAARDLRDVEQIVDQAGQVVDLPLDHLLLARDRALALVPHQPERGDDRRQRIAQLVAEHREELVLGAARRLQLAEQLLAFGLGLLDQAAPLEIDRRAIRRLVDARLRQLQMAAHLLEKAAVRLVDRQLRAQPQDQERRLSRRVRAGSGAT